MTNQQINRLQGGKLNPAQLALVRDNVLAGLTDSAIAGNLGMTVAKFRRWRNLGDSEDPAINYQYRELSAAYNGAKAALQRTLMGNVTRMATRDFQAAKWLLERHFEEDLDPTLERSIEKRMSYVFSRMQSNMSEAAFNEMIHAYNYFTGIESGEFTSEIESGASVKTIGVDVIPS